MARRLAENITSDHLSCPICIETLKDPRILPCDHILCTDCLTQLVRTSRKINSFACPIDRKKFTTSTYGLPAEQWAKSFPIDDLAVQILQTIHGESGATKRGLHCPDHDNSVCEFFCFTCLQMLCSECAVEKHRSLKCDCRSISKSSDHVNVQLNEVSDDIQRLESYGMDIFYRESEKERLLMQSRSDVQDTLVKIRKIVQDYEKLVRAKISSVFNKIEDQTVKHKVNHSADEIIQALSDKQHEIQDSISEDTTTDRLLLLTHCKAFLEQYNDRVYEILGIKENPVKLKLEIDQTFLNVCKTLEDMSVGTLHVLPADSTEFEDSVMKIGGQKIKFATDILPSRAVKFIHSFTIEIESHCHKEKPACITDIVFNGHSLILVDSSNFSVKRFRVDHGNVCVDEIKMYGVYGIANIHGNDDVIVTVPTGRHRLVRLSTYQGLRVESEIATASPYFNISPLPNKRFAVLIHEKPNVNSNKKVCFDWSRGAMSHIEIIDEDGRVIEHLKEHLLCEPKEFGQPFIMPLKSICGLPNSNIVITTETKANDVIRCIDQSGRVKWTYKMNDKPEGLCCSCDSIYVYLRESKVVRMLSFDGDLRPDSTIKLDGYNGDGHGLVLNQANKLIGIVDRTSITRLFQSL